MGYESTKKGKYTRICIESRYSLCQQLVVVKHQLSKSILYGEIPPVHLHRQEWYDFVARTLDI